MSDIDYTDWIHGIKRKAQQLGIVFLQLGATNEPARRALVDSGVTVQHFRSYLALETPITPGVLVIDKIEDLAVSTETTSTGTLREKVFRDVENGSKVVLLSRAPRMAFPPVVGSSLLDDASFARAPNIKLENPTKWPTYLEDGESNASVLSRTLMELGTNLCTSLDRVVYENLLTGTDALMLLNARELEALDGAGLTTSVGTTRTWNLPKHLAPLKEALDEVLAAALDPQQQLADVNSCLWKIERMIRREVRRKAIEAWQKNWRNQCLNNNLRTRVLNRANESAYPAATSIKQLRDPLEWLTLGELLDLKNLRQIGDLGLSAALWKQFSAQIMPIRNRLAHMRHLHPDDEANVIKWKQVLEKRLPRT